MQLQQSYIKIFIFSDVTSDFIAGCLGYHELLGLVSDVTSHIIRPLLSVLPQFHNDAAVVLSED